MKLLSTSSLFALCVLFPSSWSSPVSPGSPSERDLSSNVDSPLQPRNNPTPSTCSAQWIQTAESKANHGASCKTISSLCSTILSKYKTVTHTVYTKTVLPTTTVLQAATASRGVQTATITEQVTEQETETVGSTSDVFVTNVYTETTTVETDTVTVTANPGLKARNQWPCQQVESMLSLGKGSATPFCSCYAPGPTSTVTVTCKGVTTEPPAHVTKNTATITPTPSTAFATIFETTTQVEDVTSGTVITNTVSADTVVSVTDYVTSTFTPVAATPSYYIKMVTSKSQWEGWYAFWDPDEKVIPFISDSEAAVAYTINAQSDLQFVSDGTTYLATYGSESQTDSDAISNRVHLTDEADASQLPQFFCYASDTLQCIGPMNQGVMQLCLSSDYSNPTLVIDHSTENSDSECDVAVLQWIQA